MAVSNLLDQQDRVQLEYRSLPETQVGISLQFQRQSSSPNCHHSDESIPLFLSSTGEPMRRSRSPGVQVRVFLLLLPHTAKGKMVPEDISIK